VSGGPDSAIDETPTTDTVTDLRLSVSSVDQHWTAATDHLSTTAADPDVTNAVAAHTPSASGTIEREFIRTENTCRQPEGLTPINAGARCNNT